MSSRFAKIFTRKGTRATYDKDTSKRELPKPQEEAVTVETTTKTTKDKKADETDAKIDEEHNVEETDKVTNVQTGSSKQRAVDGVLKNKIGTESSGQATGVYSRLWKRVTEYKLSPVRYTTVAWYVPNALPFAPVIDSCCRLIGQSNHANKHEREFNPYAFALGMYYLEVIQILRSQKAAGELVGQDLSALARFEKYNPFDGIMIPEPFIPLLESLAAVELEDTKYHWIVPDHRLTFTNATTLLDICTPTINDTIRPNIPFMIANLATFGGYTRAELTDRIDEARVFTPIEIRPLAAAAPHGIQPTRFLGQDRTFDGAMAAGNDVRNVIQMCGASTPFRFWNENFYEAHLALRNSRFFVNRGIDIALTNVTHHPETGNVLLDDATKIFRSLDAYLFIAKENNPSWFQYISEQINIVSRFFPGSKPFSKIAVTGGMEPTLLCQLKLEDQQTYADGTRHYIYADTRLGRTNYNQLQFYANRFNSLTAAFTTTRGDIERNEELNAFSLGICANPPIVLDDNARNALRGGRFFQDAHSGGDAMRAQRLGFTESTIQGEVPMYDGWHDDYVKPAFSKTPTNA